jgi:hypothetical protein
LNELPWISLTFALAILEYLQTNGGLSVGHPTAVTVRLG